MCLCGITERVGERERDRASERERESARARELMVTDIN